jgi:hypothetical protein
MDRLPLLVTGEGACLLGALLVFHGAVGLVGVGGSRPWSHLVIWTGMTFGVTAAWAVLFRDVMPWGYLGEVAGAAASSRDTAEVYDTYYRLYLACLVLFHVYYAVSSVTVDWFSSTASSSGAADAGMTTRWPGVWWTLTHLMVLPIVFCVMVLDHAMRLRVPVLAQFVSLALRYQIWLVKDSAISLWAAMASDGQPWLPPGEEAVERDAPATVPLQLTWTYTGFVIHVARIISLVRLVQWLLDCAPFMGFHVSPGVVERLSPPWRQTYYLLMQRDE